MASCKPVTHVIFDLDGTLINTDDMTFKVLENIIRKYGKDLTCAQKTQFLITPSMETLYGIKREHNLPLSEKEFRHILMNGFHELTGVSYELKPGVEKLVKHLYDNNVPLAVATNGPKAICDITTKNHQKLMSCFNHFVSASTEPEVKKSKPAPDVFLVCASRFDDKPSPEKVLVIEDAPAGVEAAVAAGMQVVMVPSPLIDAKYYKNATLVLETLENFQPELFGLPPFTNEP